MADTTLLGSRSGRVNNILRSISEAMGVAQTQGLLGQDGAFSVPHGLRRAVARTAIRMIDEAEKKKPLDKMSRKEFLNYTEKLKPEEKAKALHKRRKDALEHSRVDRMMMIAESVLDEAKRKPFHKMSPEEFEAWRKKEQERKKARSNKSREERKLKKIKSIKARSEMPDDPENTYRGKGGKKLTLAPALTRMAKRRREGKIGSGKPEEKKGKAVKGGVAALRKASEELKKIGAKANRSERQAPPGVPRGKRRDMPMPRGEMPSQFKSAQERKKKDLDWLEKERQRRSGIVKKSGKLARMRGKHALLRNREHDAAKGYDQDEPKSTKKKGYHVDDTGKEVHSTGKKKNKKFANATTFRDSDTDALLHTDKSKEGARGLADTDEFVFHGDVKKDPRQKWYRVSKEGGYAAAMASLGKSYHKAPDIRQKVIDKVKSTGFTDSKGHQIDVDPTGALHNERGACVRKDNGRLTKLGKQLKKTNPKKFYRLCKGPHGPSGTPDRNEYARGFNPRHDDASKVRKLHKAAEAGKADKPERNIAQHMAARPGRRADIRSAVQSIGRKAARSARRMGKK